MRGIFRTLATVVVTTMALLAPVTTASAIVGGAPALTNPGAVSLWSDEFIVTPRHRCGATLVAPTWLVSSAHCAVVTPEDDTSVRIGSLDNTTGYVEREVERIVVHPDYDPELFGFDVMMLELDLPVPASVQVPVSYHATSAPVGTLGSAFGWGWPCQGTGSGCGAATAELRQLALEVVPDASCAAEWYPASELCLAALNGAHANGCFGDSGTPYVTKGFGSTWVLRGIVIYDGDDWNGTSCGSAPDGGPGLGVAVDVASVADWMDDVRAGLDDLADTVGEVDRSAEAVGVTWVN